jgi:long-chain fatty acid transport protein
VKRLLFLVTIVAGVTATARASDMDEFGFGARPIAMGSAFTALATDWTAPYYNPAGVAAGKTTSFGFGYSYADYHLKFKSDSTDPALDQSVAHQKPLSALSIGYASTIGTAESILNRVGVGIGIFLPTRELVSIEFETAPGTPKFFMYGARRDRIQMLPTVAVRLPLPGDLEQTQTLAVGFAANALLDMNGQFTFNLANGQGSGVGGKFDTVYALAPNVGLFYWPLDWLSCGLTYRGELSLGTHIDVVIDLTGTGTSTIPLDIKAVTYYQPQQIQGGFAVDPVDGLTLSFDLTWKNWSRFEDPFATIDRVLGQPVANFRDTWVPRIGFEYEVVRGIAVRAGYFYEPSPLPAQHGATNLIDTEKHVFSLGLGYTYQTTRERVLREKEAAVIRKEPYSPFSIDAFIQWHDLVDRRVQKDDPTASGGVGSSYEAGGDVLYFGVALTIRT